MSELNEPMGNEAPSGISRRTVTKAMAWSVPVIAVSTAVPAFAASQGFLQLTGLGCKLPGNSQELYKGYAFRLNVSNTTADPVIIDILTITLDGNTLGQTASVNLLTGATQTDPFTLPPNSPSTPIALLTELAPNSQNGVLTITYTINGGSEVQTLTATVPSAPPINGASCTAFSTAEKFRIAAAFGPTPLWQPTTQYAVGDTVRVSGGTVALVATVAGTSGTTEPTPPPPGGSVVDGTVTWQLAN